MTRDSAHLSGYTSGIPKSWMLAGLFIAMMLAFLSYRSLVFTPIPFQDYEHRIDNLMELETLADLQLLRLMRNQTLSFDDLTDAIRLLEKNSAEFIQLLQNGRHDWDNFDALYNTQLFKKIDTIDDFKSHYALYKNSSTYFDFVANEIIQDSNSPSSLTQVLHAILHNIHYFRETNDPRFITQLKQQREVLKSFSNSALSSPHYKMDSVLVHVDLIADYLLEVSRLVDGALATRLNELLEKTTEHLLQINDQEKSVAATNNRTLIVFAIVLALVIAGLFYRQRHVVLSLNNTLHELDFQKAALDEHAIVSITNVAGEIIYVNQRFCDISGYRPDELLGQQHSIINSGHHDSDFFKALWQTISCGQVWQGEVCNQAKNGGLYWVSSTIVPFIGADGKPFRYVSIRTDITARKLAETAMIEAKQAAENATQAKSQFLANMSHEIRTPITGIIGFTDLLLDDNLPDESREKVEQVKASGKSLLHVINEILDLGKLDAGKLKLYPSDSDLHALLHEVFHFFNHSKLSADSVELKLELSPDLPKHVFIDSNRLRQVITNLMGNSIKFTHHGSVILSCSLIDNGESATLQFSIKDTGIGIKQSDLVNLFNDFTQADSSLTKNYEGTGLGLAICKRIAELMDGHIDAHSEFGKGSEFVVTLPYIAAKEPAKINSERPRSNKFSASRHLKVLLAEDNHVNQLIFKKFIAQLGHEIHIVENGQAALDAHRDNAFDLILMDVRMPVMNGTEAAQLIRQQQDDKSDIPIIAVTADALSENVQQFLDAGMDDVVSKPIDKSELFLSINRVMQEKIHYEV